MKHVQILPLPDCNKLIYAEGQIARQIGTMIVADDENIGMTESYPIVAGGKSTADGDVIASTEVFETEFVCLAGEKISLYTFAKLVKKAMHEEMPVTAYELCRQLRDNGSDLKLPRTADGELVRKHHVELEFMTFDDTALCRSSETSTFFFEAYFTPGDHEDVYHQIDSQLMEYINILDTEELGTQIVFDTDDLKYMDVVDRLNAEEICTRFCDMENPR